MSTSNHDLSLVRILKAPRELVYRAWTEPELLMQWYTPRPWTVASASLDVRPGGVCEVVMRSPEGALCPNRGVYLEVVPNERLVFTDAYTEAWRPSGKAFITVEITLDIEAWGHTRYAARVSHWTEADQKAHEEMGFHQGWGAATEQLSQLLERLQTPA